MGRSEPGECEIGSNLTPSKEYDHFQCIWPLSMHMATANEYDHCQSIMTTLNALQ